MNQDMADARAWSAPADLRYRMAPAVRRIGRRRPWGPGCLALVVASAAANASDVNDKLELNGLIASAYQSQHVIGSADADNACRSGLALQPELAYAPIAEGLVFVKLGFGLGNGLNNVSPFELAPWAADLEAM